MPSAFCIHQIVPGFVVYHLNSTKTLAQTNKHISELAVLWPEAKEGEGRKKKVFRDVDEASKLR
jgi:hypothetical protein